MNEEEQRDRFQCKLSISPRRARITGREDFLPTEASVTQTHQLDIPAGAQSQSDSFEIVRVWVAKGAQHVSLRTGIWKDPAAWGLLLADLARHIVNSYDQDPAIDRREILGRIRAGFDAEMDSPTDPDLS